MQFIIVILTISALCFLEETQTASNNGNFEDAEVIFKKFNATLWAKYNPYVVKASKDSTGSDNFEIKNLKLQIKGTINQNPSSETSISNVAFQGSFTYCKWEISLIIISFCVSQRDTGKFNGTIGEVIAPIEWNILTPKKVTLDSSKIQTSKLNVDIVYDQEKYNSVLAGIERILPLAVANPLQQTIKAINK